MWTRLDWAVCSKDVVNDLLGMGIDSRLLGKNLISLKLCYAPSKLDNCMGRDSSPRRERQVARLIAKGMRKG